MHYYHHPTCHPVKNFQWPISPQRISPVSLSCRLEAFMSQSYSIECDVHCPFYQGTQLSVKSKWTKSKWQGLLAVKLQAGNAVFGIFPVLFRFDDASALTAWVWVYFVTPQNMCHKPVVQPLLQLLHSHDTNAELIRTATWNQIYTVVLRGAFQDVRVSLLIPGPSRFTFLRTHNNVLNSDLYFSIGWFLGLHAHLMYWNVTWYRYTGAWTWRRRN